MENSRLRTIAEIGLTIALFAVLDYLRLKLPINIAGGSISLAMAPILVLAFFRGPAVGLLAGALCGGIDLFFDAYTINIFQTFLDYPIAYGLVGLAGVVSRQLKASFDAKKLQRVFLGILAGVGIAAVGRFLAHFLSGVIFFGSNAPKGQNIFLYSAVYNLGYLIPSFIGCAIICFVVVPSLMRYFWSE